MRRVKRLVLVGLISCAAVSAFAEDTPPAKSDNPVPSRIIDPAVCADPTAVDCSALIADDKADKRKRIDALLIRAKTQVAADRPARALADYDAVLTLDPTLTDVRNTRGELRRATGDRPGALADFTAVLKVCPDHEQARENRKSLAKEIEKIGAEMAIGRKIAPSDKPLK